MQELRLLAYSSGNFAKNLVFSSADLTFLFILTELVGLSAGHAASIMLAALLGDLVFDFAVAKIVIALRRHGKGYRWLLVMAAPPCGLAFAFVYSMPAHALLGTWLLVAALAIFRGAYAIVDVPHNAMMSSLTTDSGSRGRVSGYRRFFSTCASFVIALVLTPAVQKAAQGHAYTALSHIGIAAGLTFTIVIILGALLSRSTVEGMSRLEVRGDGIKLPFANPSILAMTLLGILTGLAVPAFERTLLYLGTYVLKSPDLVPNLLIVLSVGQFAGVFLWTMSTRWVGNPDLLAIGHGLCALSLALVYAALNSSTMLYVCVLLLGVAQTCVFMLPWAILADIVDLIDWKIGRRYEAGLFAFFLVVVKVSGAASSSLTGFILEWAGYVPGGQQTPLVQHAMLAFGIGLPLSGSLLAMIVSMKLPLDHRRHARIVHALGRREQGRLNQSAQVPSLSPG